MALVRAGLVGLCLLLSAGIAIVASKFCTPGGRTAQVLARWFCRAMLRLLRVRVEVIGTPPQDGDGRMLVANHVSWIDPLVLLSVLPACVLAKQEVGTWPAIGALARLQATVFVDRGRRRGIPRVNSDLAERLAQRRNVLLFPEGTTYDGDRRGRFLTSHLACLAELMKQQPSRPAADAQVAAIAYSNRAAAWIGDATLLPHLWSTLRNPGLTCTVAFGATHTVGRGYDRKALGRDLAAEVEALIEECRSSQKICNWRQGTPPSGLIVTQT